MLRVLGPLIGLAVAPLALAAFQPVTLVDGGQRLDDLAQWRPYCGAVLTPMQTPTGAPAVHVQTAANQAGGFAVTVTPRGGFGNRVQIRLRHRVLSGQPVTVWTGPNTWNQVGAVLASADWERVCFEVGLVGDFPLVLHVVQPPGGVFEFGDLQVQAQGPEPAVRRALGPVDMAVTPLEGGDLTRRFITAGDVVIAPGDGSQEAKGLCCRLRLRGAAAASQSLGALPAGTRLQLLGRAQTDAAGVTVGLQRGGTALAQAPLAPGDWRDVTLAGLLDADGAPQWGIAGAGAAEVQLRDMRALVTLPDPLAPGVVALPPRQPLVLTNPDPKSILIQPPWPGLMPIKCHLEYNSRWGFRDPDRCDAALSPAGDALRLVWHVNDDPVVYAVSMRVEGMDAVEVEASLANGSAEPIAAFSPGFCVQIPGFSAPHTFAYTMIPVQGRPLRLDQATPFAPTAEPWPGIGWVRAGYVDSAAYRERVAQGAAWVAPPSWVREVGEAPLLARRLPGRDAWIAWTWPTAVGYFANTQAPCMHMDPVFPPVAPGQTVTLKGRLWFFAGTWAELHEAATRR